MALMEWTLLSSRGENTLPIWHLDTVLKKSVHSINAMRR